LSAWRTRGEGEEAREREEAAGVSGRRGEERGGDRLEVDDRADGWAPVVGEREREGGEVGRRGRLGRAGSETGRC
jgi:hypothetical protein